jgi:hypothetical protein
MTYKKDERQKRYAASSIALAAAALASITACQSPPPPAGKGATSPASSASMAAAPREAPPPAQSTPKELPRPSQERAGAPDCALGAPADIAVISKEADKGSILGVGTKAAFGPEGGLVTWGGGEKEGRARPIGRDGRPTGPERAFPVEKSFYSQGIVPVLGWFVLVYNLFDVRSLGTRYFAQSFSLAGEARGAPMQLDIGEHFFEGMSEAAGGRFIILGGPNQAHALQSARAIVVSVAPTGELRQEVIPLPITAPSATRPSVAFAVTPEHWAMTVQVQPGEDTQTMARIDGRMTQRVPTGAKLGGIEALVVDGQMRPIQGAGAGKSTGMLSAANRYRIEWMGEELAVEWSEQGEGDKAAVRRGRLSKTGELRSVTDKDEAVGRALEDRISVSYASGGGEGTILYRVTVVGERVGNEMRIDGALPDTDTGILNMDIAWAGDRFVIAHEVKVNGATTIRAVGLRCDGSTK